MKRMPKNQRREMIKGAMQTIAASDKLSPAAKKRGLTALKKALAEKPQ
ncbi:MAG TPA: hypothetical protein GX528_07140 [Firmicutes bacterium]|nr:hypothetical protein [Bacillota bacterium]